MKAIITGISGVMNRGVEALLVTTIEPLSQREQNLTINILTDTPDYDQIRFHQNNVNFINSKNKNEGWMHSLRGKISKIYKPLAREYELFRDASIVIASGGDLFSSDYGGLFPALRPLELALHAGVPVVFLAQSIGLFKTDEEAELWLSVARRSSLITVREQLSYNYVTQKLGLSEDLVKHTADSAFLLEPPPPPVVKNLLKSYGVREDSPVVAIAPSQLISSYADNQRDKHLNAWCQVVNEILNELKAQIIIIPHVHDNRLTNDDRILATKIHRHFDFDPRIHLVGGDNSASEFKGIIAACDLLIAERMHASIAGLSSSICTVVVGYSIKAEGIMSDLFGTEAVEKGLLISIEQFLDIDIACRTIHTAWSQRHDVSTHLQKVLPQVKNKAAHNFDLILQIMS
ncbi:MAG: polysaccharide pyruvyl transferase family protein [Coleofasciculus chthonoplastes F3-SA18-01]|uniref:polysaccharide pyruvyl transferase family protein n=1 Tax=Coleofasciculus chthonoplastes TaxID=64178 RepID=UPI0032FA7D75